MTGYKKWLSAIPLLLICLLAYKYRYKLQLATKDENKVIIDSSYYYKSTVNTDYCAHGLVMDKQFNGIDATKYKVKKLMSSGLDMINSEQYLILKMYDEKSGIEVYISIRDFKMLDRVPFTTAFDDGQRILITAFVKNEDGVNVMYGGTIYNCKGKLRITGYNKQQKVLSGILDAHLQAVTANGYCKINNLVFNKVIADYNMGM